MQRVHKFILFGLAIALPITAQGVQIFQAPKQPCFAAGSAIYRVSATAPAPDYQVKIDNRAAHPDLHMQLVDDPAAADFVLVDDVDTAASSDACRTARPLKTIQVNDAAPRADLTISLAGGAAADFKLYVHSARFSHEEAAALFGVMWQAARPRDMAAVDTARDTPLSRR